MADRFVVSHLKRLPLFALLTPEQLEVVANAVQVLRFEPREVLFSQGQPALGLIILVSGLGDLIQIGPDNIQRSVGVVRDGEYLNEAALFSEVIAPMTLLVRETSIVLYLSRQKMVEVLTYQPDIAAALQSRPAFPSPVSQSSQAIPVPAQPKVFAGQREDEKVVIQTRRHWWAFVRRIWLTVFIILGVILFVGALRDATLLALTLPVILLGLGISGYLYMEWRNDLFVVTDQRVVNIRRDILTFSNNFNEIPLLGIHEVTVFIPVTDPMARLFHYGTLAVKTTGDITNLTIDFLPNPKSIQDTVFAQQKAIKNHQSEQARSLTRNAIRSDIDKFLGRAPGTSDSVPLTTTSPIPATPQGFLSTRYINDKGETVYRKHWVVWLQHVIPPGVVVLVGLILVVAGMVGAANTPNLGFVGVAIAVVIILAGSVWLYLSDWDWRNDLYIVGDQTVTLIHKRPLWLQNQKDQILLAQVDNVISEMSGFLQSMFDVGNVGLLLTGADAKDAKWFKSVHHPQSIQQEVSRRQEQARRRQQDDQAQRERQQIVEYLSVYHESLGGQPPTSAPSAQSSPGGISPDRPPRVQDRTRPPGIPLVRRDNSPKT